MGDSCRSVVAANADQRIGYLMQNHVAGNSRIGGVPDVARRREEFVIWTRFRCEESADE